MAGPTDAAKREKSSCQNGAVHTWHLASFRCAAEFGHYRGIAQSGRPSARPIYEFWPSWIPPKPTHRLNSVCHLASYTDNGRNLLPFIAMAVSVAGQLAAPAKGVCMRTPPCRQRSLAPASPPSSNTDPSTKPRNQVGPSMKSTRILKNAWNLTLPIGYAPIQNGFRLTR